MAEQITSGIRPDVDDMIEFLNSVLKIDPVAISHLFFNRVPCNKGLADHPSVQVGNVADCVTDYDLGVLGLINGYFGAYTDGDRRFAGAIVMKTDNGVLVEFVKNKCYATE